MRKWKCRLKCSLALLLAAVLAGSNADGLLLSAFAEEGTYQEDGQLTEGQEGTEDQEEMPDGEPAGGADNGSLKPAEMAGSPEQSGTEASGATIPENPEEGQPEEDPVEPTKPENPEGSQSEGSPAEPTKPENPEGNQPEGSPAESTGAENPEVNQSEDQKDYQEDGDSQANETETRTEEEVFVPDVELPENDELFEGYVYQLFYGDAGISLYGNVGEASLDGDERTIYDTLKAFSQDVAAGKAPSTKNIPVNGLSIPSAQVSPTVKKVVNYLLMDCPYDLYWYDKTVGVHMQYVLDSTDKATNLELSMAVATEYSSGDYTIDTSKVSAAQTAAQRAKAIVETYKDKSDYEKLVAYRTEICNLVSYNNEAAGSNKTDYGNPWQLIWVFDENDATNVVCEGYSKAFQYLCDLSEFSGGTICYTVSGVMAGGTGEGPHMWNIVTIGGKNYLVDVTNCDTGTVGAPDQLFLTGTSGSIASGYSFTLGSQKITYTYDADQQGLLGGVLELAEEPYHEKGALTIVNPKAVTVTYGDQVENTVLTGAGGEAKDANGNIVAGTFSWAADVKSYGDAGKRTLYAVFTPENTTDYRTVSNIPVEITVNPKPITVTANNKTKTYGEADPAFDYKSEGLVGSDTLSGQLARDAGEEVKNGGYVINQGTLTNDNNRNYNITFTPGTLTINPAVCKPVDGIGSQNVLQGVGDFTQPTFRGVKDEAVEGEITYSYDTLSNVKYEAVKEKLAQLTVNASGDISYSFVPKSANYSGPVTGTIHFTVKEIEFLVDGQAATAANAVSLKKDAVYGDSWEEIVTIGAITARAGTGSDNEKGHFTLSKTGRPNAGDDQEFEILYNGTVGGKTYTNEPVCAGKVNVAKRTITVSAGSYKVSKVYDKTLTAGTASGTLAAEGILAEDTGVSVSAVPVDYTNPNVGGQAQMEVPVTLNGDTLGNYVLASAKAAVPCEITPKPVVPVMEITGSYSYTGQAIVPTLTVKVGEEVLTASDYEVALQNNINAGTAAVSVTPKKGGNYTWSNAVEGTFSIGKVDYPYARTAELSARYGNEGTFDLASLLPAGYKLGTVGVSDPDGILQGTPAVSGTVLSYQLNADRSKVGKKAIVTVPVTESTNYNAFELTLTVTMSDKLEQTEFRFKDTVASKVYGDGSYTAEVLNAAPGSTLSFTSSNPNVAIVDNSGKVQILNAGTTVLTAWASETKDYIRGTAVCTLNVAPRALSWDVSALSAVDREGTISEQKKASLYGELRVTGILEADRDQVTFTCPAGKLAGTYAATTPGTQRVVLAWANAASPALLQGARAANYILPSALPEVQGRINPVSGGLLPPAESTGQVQFNLSMEKGISQVPPALAGMENLNTPAKVEAQMKQNIQSKVASVPQENTAVYDITLMVNVNGAGWQVAGKSNFPANGLTITLPYPEGTGRDANDFVVCHLFTEDMNGHKAGEVEYPAVTKTESGIRFKVYGLSPISVGWTKAGELNNTVEVTETDDISTDSQQSAAADSPKTSDEYHLAWYLIAMAVSGGLLAGMILYGRRRRNRH